MSSGGSRLWPVLSVLLALLCGASGLEYHARTRAPRAIVVQVRAQALVSGGADDDEGDDNGEPQADADAAAPISAAHARARELGRLGEFADAITSLRAEIATQPSEPALHADLGYFLLLGRHVEEAISELTTARDLGSSSPYTLLNLGVALRRFGDLESAEKALRAALERKPGFRAARLALSTVLRRQNRFDEGAAILRDLAGSGGNASRAEALLALGKLELGAGHGKRADRAFEQAIEWLPSQPEVRISAARAYLSQSSQEYVAKARAIAQTAVAMAPDLAQAYGTLARAKQRAHDSKGAAEDYERALGLRPDYVYARRHLLRLALDRLDFKQAESHAEQLLAQAKDVPEHHFLAGLVAARSDRVEEARTHYLAAIAAAGDDYPEAYFNLGLLEKGAGRLAEAISAYEQAIDRDPRYLPALNNLGLALAARDDVSEARNAYARALSVNPGYAPAWINLGKAQLHDNDAAAAVKSFERAVAIWPRSQEALLNLGVAFRRANRIADAEATYRKLIAAQPRYVSAWYNLGIAIEHAGRGIEARAAYQQALAFEPDHLPSLRRLARLLLKQNELASSAELYQSLLDQNPTDKRSRVALAEIHRRRGDQRACAQAISAAMAADGRGDAPAMLGRCRSTRAADALRL